LQVAFELRLSALLPSESSEPFVAGGPLDRSPLASDEKTGTGAGPGDAGADEPARVDKSTLPVPAPRRYRDKAHLRYVAQQACLLCSRKPSDPHHLRHLQPRALGRKASDEFAVPLCRIHHRLVHRVGNEAAWWKDSGIDPAKAARKLWNDSRMDQGRIAPRPTAQCPAADRTAEVGGSTLSERSSQGVEPASF